MEEKKMKSDAVDDNIMNEDKVEENIKTDDDAKKNNLKDKDAGGNITKDGEAEEKQMEDGESEENDADTTSESDENSDKKKKKHFKKKKDPKDEQIEELNDKYQRLFAEFQNYRNRSEKEKSSMFDMGARNIIEKILPIVDNFERGIAALGEDDLKSPVGQGMDMIYKQMLKTLEEIGVEVIEAEGKEFDPELHNAVMQVQNDELEENTVAAELQKGYIYKGIVIRHSMVSVVTK